MAPPNRDELLAVVERSPRTAAAHDRAGWVGLFTADGRVEDPVGSRPHVGRDQIGRFYDTFIGPRDITFHRDLDVVSGSVVLRDLTLQVAMSPTVTMRIPAFLRYDLREVNGQWRIAVLRAYWELPAMILQLARTGLRSMAPAVQLSRELIGHQRLAGAVGFMAGFRRVGGRHKRLVDAFLRAAAQGDEPTARDALGSTATITLGGGEVLERLGIVELVERFDGVSWAKMNPPNRPPSRQAVMLLPFGAAVVPQQAFGDLDFGRVRIGDREVA